MRLTFKRCTVGQGGVRLLSESKATTTKMTYDEVVPLALPQKLSRIRDQGGRPFTFLSNKKATDRHWRTLA